MELKNRIKKEKINISNTEHATKEIENSLITNCLRLLNDFTLAKQKYMATSKAWQQNIMLYNIYEEKHRLGRVSSLELITAKDILNTSNSKYLQAKFELFFQYQLLQILKANFDLQN